MPILATSLLDDNEGIDVQNIYTGRVRAVIDATYMLIPDIELFLKRYPLTGR